MRNGSRPLVLLCLLLATPAARAGDPAPPEPRESFTFVIFGDRTGGRPDGLKVLETAVAATNRLDPDFTMTVGDLVQGYNSGEQWLPQMRAFKAVMQGLHRPWYPVAGNHDVYGGKKNRKEGNVALYEEYFGPLYYSFDYKWAHFVVLYSDEQLSFSAPGSQNMSPKQLAWLKADLARTKAKQVYVFLHHPRWIYRDTNWPDVHALMAKDGRVKACFAGHVHAYRDDGVKDGIHYFVLAVTGGGAGVLKTPASLHHLNYLKVTPDGFSMSVHPIGAVVGSDLAYGAEVDRLWSMTRGAWVAAAGAPVIELDGPSTSTIDVTVTNPEEVPAAYDVRLRVPKSWQVKHRFFGGQLAPKKSARHTFEVTSPAFDGRWPGLRIQSTLHVPLRSGLIHPVTHRRDVAVRVAGVPSARKERNGVLQLDGRSAVRIDPGNVPEQFTLECWVRGHAPKGRAAVVSRAEAAGFGLWWSFQGQKHPYAMISQPDGYKTLPASAAWTWDQWTHLALSAGENRLRFFVNGKLQAEAPRTGARRRAGHSIFVGGDPDRRNRLSYAFTGSIDEVRLSRGARYEEDFEPARTFARDEDTLLLLHLDAQVKNLFPDDSGHDRHGWPVGNARIIEETR